MNKLGTLLLMCGLLVSCVSQQKQLTADFNALKGKYWSLNNLIVKGAIYAVATEEGFDAVPTPFIQFNENGQIWIKLDEDINGKGSYQLNGNHIEIKENKCSEQCKLASDCGEMNELLLYFFKQEKITYELSDDGRKLSLNTDRDAIEFYLYEK